MKFRLTVTLAKPTAAWPYVVLATIVCTDGALATLVPKDCGWAQCAFALAVTCAKSTMAAFVFDYGFRTSMDAWRERLRRERDKDHALFVHRMEQARAESDEQHRRHMRAIYAALGDDWKAP